MNRRRCALLLCITLIPWGGAVGSAHGQVGQPSDSDLRIARERMGAALGVPATAAANDRPTVPDVRSLPQPVTQRSDIADMAVAHRPPTPNSLSMPAADVPELMVFVSFSLPRETLQRIVNQAEQSGAVLVLRGLKGNSLSQMGKEIAELIGTRKVTAIIHPPAFQQFRVRQVPSLVLARSGQASHLAEDGCAPALSFVRIDGDVSQDYAFDLIERQAPAWADLARRYAARLVGQRP